MKLIRKIILVWTFYIMGYVGLGIATNWKVPVCLFFVLIGTKLEEIKVIKE